MDSAKDHGRARVERYDAGSRDRAVSILRTGNELHRALERGEMSVYYQPIMSLETQRIAGFEALLRWQHPERGRVGPESELHPQEAAHDIPLRADDERRRQHARSTRERRPLG